MTVNLESRNTFFQRSDLRKPLKTEIRNRLLTSRLGKGVISKAVPWATESGTEAFFETTGKENISELGPYIEEGRLLVIVSNHESQGDVGAMVMVAKEVIKNFPKKISEFDYFVAKSMGTGDQGVVLKTVYNHGIFPWMDKNMIHPAPVISDNDKRRGLVRSSEDVREVLKLITNGRPKIIHPQGSMDAGRIDPTTGKRRGMGEMSESGKSFFSLLDRKGIKAVMLPVGIHGYYEFFDPETLNFTKEGIEMFTDLFMMRIGGLQTSELVGSIRIGNPVSLETLNSAPDKSDEIMKIIAKLVPYSARGIYK